MEDTQKQVWQAPQLIEADVAEVTLGAGAANADGDGAGS